jgi:hypothetical protein
VIVGDEFVLPCVLGVLVALMPALDDGSFLTNAPMTPRDVSRRYSNGLDFDVVFKKGYRKSGMCAGTY